MVQNVKLKHAGGRPTKYKPEFCEAIIEFFDIEPYKEVVKKRFTRKDGEVIEEMGLQANDPVFFEDFAYSVGVSMESVVAWTKIYPEFLTAYLHAKHLQLKHFAINGNQQTFNSYFAIFTVKNISHWRDKIDIEHELGDKTLDKYAELNGKDLQRKALELANIRTTPQNN